MKSIKFTSLLIIALALTIGATGCKKKPVGVTTIPGHGTQVKDGEMTGIGGGGTIGKGDEVPLGGGLQSTINPGDYNPDPEALKPQTIHFDYDSSVIRSGDKGNVEAVAAYMKSAPAGTALLVEGNCDERGTEEYNRALGERRALAAREMLVANGVDGQRIVTRSNGKDKPVSTGNDESSHRQNRRDDFIVLHPK